MFVSIIESVIIPIIIGFLLNYFWGNKKIFKDIQQVMSGVSVIGLATNLATAHFAATPQAAVACTVSCVWHSISGTLLAGLYAKFDEKKEATYEFESINE